MKLPAHAIVNKRQLGSELCPTAYREAPPERDPTNERTESLRCGKGTDTSAREGPFAQQNEGRSVEDSEPSHGSYQSVTGSTAYTYLPFPDWEL